MSKYRANLPQLSDRIFLTDGGLETTLIFEGGLDLPYFASFPLVETESGRKALDNYYESYVEIALTAKCGLVLDSATWRANPEWAARLGYDAPALDVVNRRAIELASALRDKYETEHSPIVVNGVIGPRGDGYIADAQMTAEEARDYHLPQIESFAAAGADMATALTLNYPEEAIGVALAARMANLPVAIAFTVETDGRLPNGATLGDAIEAVEIATAGYPAYYMINCAHPTHFQQVLESDAPWITRIRGIRANSSKRSHAELDSSPDLDSGDPVELGQQYRALRNRHQQFTVLGGCCGTDKRHIQQIGFACLAS